jgi:hypothetical protein
MSTYEATQAFGTAGSLELHVRYAGDTLDEGGGGVRRCYRYHVEDTSSPDGPVVGTDLHSGVGAPVDPRAALATLAAFVSAAGEAYGHTMCGGESDNRYLFRRGIAEAAYMNSDELQLLALDLEQSTSTDRRSPGVGPPTPRPDAPSL